MKSTKQGTIWRKVYRILHNASLPSNILSRMETRIEVIMHGEFKFHYNSSREMIEFCEFCDFFTMQPIVQCHDI